MDRNHKIYDIERETTRWVHVVRRETDEKANDLQAGRIVPEIWKHMSDASKREERQKWDIEKPKLHNARSLRGIYFIDPKDEEIKDIMRNARRKLEIPMPAAMPCKTPANCRGETCRTIGKHKTKYARIVEAGESMRIRLEGNPCRYHEDHIAAKGMDSLSHNNLVHKFILMPQALKIPDAKAAAEKEGSNSEKMPAWQLTKVRNKNEVIAEARNEGRKSAFCVIDGSLSSQQLGVGATNSRHTKEKLYSEATL